MKPSDAERWLGLSLRITGSSLIDDEVLGSCSFPTSLAAEQTLLVVREDSGSNRADMVEWLLEGGSDAPFTQQLWQDSKSKVRQVPHQWRSAYAMLMTPYEDPEHSIYVQAFEQGLTGFPTGDPAPLGR